MLILAGITINALTGSDSAPARANEAKQKNDIGSAKDQLSVVVQNAHLEAYDDIYVQNNESVKSTAATTTVGQRVINAALAKYQTPQQFGDATMQVIQTTEGQDAIVTIKTRDFEQNGTISADGGVLSWEALKSSETIVDHISLSTNSITINKGDTSSLITATAYTQNNQEITGKTATFTSSDTNIATVNENGVVTGVTAGTTTITVTIDGKTANCTIVVNKTINDITICQQGTLRYAYVNNFEDIYSSVTAEPYSVDNEYDNDRSEQIETIRYIDEITAIDENGYEITINPSERILDEIIILDIDGYSQDEISLGIHTEAYCDENTIVIVYDGEEYRSLPASVRTDGILDIHEVDSSYKVLYIYN